MRMASYDRVEPQLPTELPVRLMATCSQREAAVLLILAVPAALAVALGSMTLLVHAASAPGARAVLAQHPALGLEIVAGLAFWGCLLGLPLKRLFHRLAVRRTVEIGDGTVRVTEGGHFRTWAWSMPLSAYSGVAHHVRASLSGTRHELILVHPERQKSVLLSLSSRISQGEVDRVAALLGHKEVPPSALYRFKKLWRGISQPAWREPAHA